jgi:hypothetical protein
MELQVTNLHTTSDDCIGKLGQGEVSWLQVFRNSVYQGLRFVQPPHLHETFIDIERERNHNNER